MLTINPGPLPEDGTRIRIAQVLDAFVSGTTLTNFGQEDFATAEKTFFSSQTEAPATSARTRATLWFARGEGTLYRWEIFPSATGSTAATEGAWVAMSNRREVLVKQVRTINPGDALTVAHDADTFKYEQAADGRHTICVNATGSTDIVHLIDPVFVATDSAATYAVATEWGFVDAKVRGSGEFAFLQRSTDAATFRLTCTDSSGWTNTNARFGIVSQSDATDGDRLLRIFKTPQLTNWVR